MASGPADWDSVERIAWYCARHHMGVTPSLTVEDRYQVALDAIVEHIAGEGWPDGDLKPLFRAAKAGIQRTSNRDTWDTRRWQNWHSPPSADDALAEAVTDRIGVQQVVWLLTEGEWAAVWAVAETIRLTGHASIGAAAASLGITEQTVYTHLTNARRKCRAAWVAPGETLRRNYRPQRNRYQHWRANQTMLLARRLAA